MTSSDSSSWTRLPGWMRLLKRPIRTAVASPRISTSQVRASRMAETDTIAPAARVEEAQVEAKDVKVEEPAKRKSGIKVKTVAELVDKLKNEAGVI